MVTVVAVQGQSHDVWPIRSSCIPHFGEELRNAFVTELEMTKVMDGDKCLTAVNRGRLTKTCRQWFRSRFPDKAQSFLRVGVLWAALTALVPSCAANCCRAGMP